MKTGCSIRGSLFLLADEIIYSQHPEYRAAVVWLP